MATTVMHTRIDEELKSSAESILKQIGLSSSEAVRIFYRQIEINQGIPFDLKIPNKTTAKTLKESAQGENIHQADDAEDLFSQLGI